MSVVKSGLVSVIVASYNHAEYLEQRMVSLINQTYENIEIIVIDDHSTDNSVDVLLKYETHPKVKLFIREKNGGWVEVSNQGVNLSVGEYVLFANCDDSCDPRMISRLVESMLANPTAGISYCRSLLIDEKGTGLGDDFLCREKAFRIKCFNDVLISKHVMRRFLLNSCVIPNLSAALFRKVCFASVGGFTAGYRVCSDWDLFFRIVDSHDVAYIAEPLNLFRQHENTIRSSTKEKVIYEEFMRLLLEQIASIDLTLLERIKYRSHVMSLWSLHLLHPSLNGFFNFLYHLKIVMRLDPIALCFLPTALLLRVIQLPIKIVNKAFKKMSTSRKYNVS